MHDFAPVSGGAASGPAGIPISRAIMIPQGALAMDADAVLAAIDAVHGDGALPAIPLNYTTSGSRRGAYKDRSGSGVPVEIVVSTSGNTPRLTLAHEVGHFLDHQGLGRPGIFMTGDRTPGGDLTARWRAAIVQSQAFHDLIALSVQTTVEVTMPDGTTHPAPVNWSFIQYLMGYDELWARSYGQYVATRGGDPQVRRELDAERRRDPAEVYYPRQWDDVDFAPVAAAIDGLFASLGWIA